jgi:hypothetical protein
LRRLGDRRARKGDAGAGDFNRAISCCCDLYFFKIASLFFLAAKLICPLRLWRSVSAFSSELSGSGFGCGSSSVSCFFGASSSILRIVSDHSANIFHNPLAKSANIFYKRFLLLNIRSTTGSTIGSTTVTTPGI